MVNKKKVLEIIYIIIAFTPIFILGYMNEMYLDMRQKGNDDRASYWQGKYFMVEDVAMRMFGDKLQKYQSPLDFIKNLERL